MNAASFAAENPSLVWGMALKSWVNCAPIGERSARKEAERRIKACYASKRSDCIELDLSGLGLTSIDGLSFPPYIHTLRLNNNEIASIAGVHFQRIKFIYLNHNKIASIDGAQFQEVEWLYLDQNQITFIENVRFQGVIGLYLSHNQITSIDGVDFRGVKELYLDHNQISSIADVDFQGIERLRIRHNPITHLPSSLAALADDSIINTEHCHLNLRETIAFQDVINARRIARQPHPHWLNTIYEEYLENASSLEGTIAQYLQIAHQMSLHLDKMFFTETLAADLNALFSNEEKETLNQFLQRLKNTADFKNPRSQGGIVFAVYQMLAAAANSVRLPDQSPSFKVHLVALIHEALETCSDRVAITLNRIELQRRLDTMEMDIQNLIGYRRVQLVYEAVQKIVQLKSLGDAIEPMLYLQNKLKNRLKLPIVTEGMLYPLMAQITNDELERIAQEIEGATSSFDAQLAILTEKLAPLKMGKNRLVNLGTLSKTNPFSCNIHDLWGKHLQQKYKDEYKQIVSRFSDDDLIDPAKIEEWNHERNKLTIKLTKELLKKSFFENHSSSETVVQKPSEASIEPGRED